MNGIKKRLYIVGLALVVFIVAIAFLAVGCGEPETEFDRMKRLVSHQQTELLTASNEHFEVIFVAGITEVPFIADGLKGETAAFARLRIMPKNYGYINNNYDFELIGEHGSIKGELTKDALGIGFSTEVTGIDGIGLPSRAVITERCEGEGEEDESVPKYEFELVNLMSNMISGEAALEIALEEFSERIAQEQADGTFRREIQLRLLNDTSNFDSPYHWFITFVGDNFDYFAVLINSGNGSVISVRR
jgi:hypothetical protein